MGAIIHPIHTYVSFSFLSTTLGPDLFIYDGIVHIFFKRGQGLSDSSAWVGMDYELLPCISTLTNQILR